MLKLFSLLKTLTSKTFDKTDSKTYYSHISALKMTQEYEDTLKDAIEHILGTDKFSERVQQQAVLAASEGTEIVEAQLAKMIENIHGGALESLLPGDFLESACREMWIKGKRIEPIMYLYERHYDDRVSVSEDDEGTRVGTQFTSLMAEFAASVKGTDRGIIVDSTIRFVTRHNPDMIDRVIELAYFAKDLTANGAKAEGSHIANFLLQNAKPQLYTLTEIEMELIQEAISGSPQV